MHFILILLNFLVSSITGFAQQEQKQDLFHLYATDGKQSRNPSSYFIVAFKKSIPSSVPVKRKLGDQIAIISAEQIKQIPGSIIERTASASNNWKLSQISLLNNIKTDRQHIIVGGDLSMIIDLCKQQFPDVSVIQTDSVSQTAVIRTGKQTLLKLLDHPAVTFVDIQRKPSAEIGIIGYDRGFHGINTLADQVPGANGHDIVVGVKEQKMEEQDLDLYKRILPSPLAAENTSDHATVISSIIGGAGNSFYDGLGIASNCRFFPSSFANLFPDDLTALKTAKVSVQNHSYGTVIQQFYGAEALAYDAQTVADKDLVHVFSAGNQGTAASGEGIYANLPGFANLTGNFKMAKNVITVGAIDNKGIIATESSAGPLYDGRIAPQLIALGPNGTSDAAAMVSGTVAILQQVYADSNQQLPPSSLIRAILYSSADDVHNKGIDHKTGYGLLNTFKAVTLLQHRTYFNSSLNNGDEWTKTITIPANSSAVKITLAWNDAPSSLNTYRTLVNDLDLDLIDLQTDEVYHPWVLSSYPHIDSLKRLPVRGRDSLNNAEQISLQMPAPGVYILRVSSAKQLILPVDFSIAYCIDTLHTFRFTSPRQAADVNPEEDSELNVRWMAEVADSSATGQLSVSYDHGNSWEIILSSVKLTDRLYRWPLPLTPSSALLKMKTPWGDFLSNEFIISRITRPRPDFVCTDSFRLSWNKHIYAERYAVFGLTDSAYMKKLFTVTDTFIVVDRKKYSSLVYAVQPILSNHLQAARSVAMHIELQGVQCFFRTLNYVLENDNKLRMTLELSAPSYADSVFFEQVTESGIRQKIFGSMRAEAGRFLYDQSTGHPASGTIYIRAAIKQKTGEVVYTDIIPVFTSGEKNILFYPNPVNRWEALRYVIRQGISPDCRLQIFNANGQPVRDIYSLPQSIRMNDLTSGIYLLKLTDRSGKTIATEKVVVP